MVEAEGGGLAPPMVLTSKDLVLANLPGDSFPIRFFLLFLLVLRSVPLER